MSKMFTGQFGRHRYEKVQFGTAPLEYFFQGNRSKVQRMSNVFSIADVISIVGYDEDGKDHERAYTGCSWYV